MQTKIYYYCIGKKLHFRKNKINKKFLNKLHLNKPEIWKIETK